MGAIELDQAGPFQSAALPPLYLLCNAPSLAGVPPPIHTSSHRGLEQDMGGEKGRRCLENGRGP